MSCCREYVQAFSEWAVGVLMFGGTEIMFKLSRSGQWAFLMFGGVWRMAIFRSTVNIWESE